MTKYEVLVVGVPCADKWRRLCNIRVAPVGQGMGRGYRDRCIYVSASVDSRYTGSRSAYGQAMKRAMEICNAMNDPILRAVWEAEHGKDTALHISI